MMDQNNLMTTTLNYDESAIPILDVLSHIRLRTEMYIERIGDGTAPNDGIYILMKEVIDNSIDEFIMGQGKRILITRKDRTISVRDFGRGIPLGKLVDCVSQINIGGKYNTDVFQFSVGLNGVGIKVVNALSSEFEAISYRDKQYHRALFCRGKLIEETSGETTESNGTYICFTPDSEIFGDFAYNDDYIERRLRYYAYLNAGLKLVYNKNSILYNDGLVDLLREEIGEAEILYPIVHIQSEHLEVAFTHLTETHGQKYYSFVNGYYTSDGGTHLLALRKGIRKGINAFAKKNYFLKDICGSIVGAIAIKMVDPQFERPSKNKLISDVDSLISNIIRDEVVLWMNKNNEDSKKLLAKIENNAK